MTGEKHNGSDSAWTPGWCGKCSTPPGTKSKTKPVGMLERYFEEVAKLPVMAPEDVISLARKNRGPGGDAVV